MANDVSQLPASNKWPEHDVGALEDIAKAWIIAHRREDYDLLKALCIPSARFLVHREVLVTNDIEEKWQNTFEQGNSYNPKLEIIMLVGDQAVVRVDQVMKSCP